MFRSLAHSLRGSLLRPSLPLFAGQTFEFKLDPVTWEDYIAVHTRGRSITFDPLLNKGTAFSERERRELKLEGIFPPRVCEMDVQLKRVYEGFKHQETDLNKYLYLCDLHDRNETLFFRLLHEHIEEMMPIVYTPVVGLGCQKFGHIFRRARGLFVSYDQKDHIAEVLRNFHTRNVSAIVVTDGERILGLGDQGTGGMGIPIGKLALYTLCAGVSPFNVLPITLDVGTDNEERLKDPLYLGLRHKRIRGAEYQDFIDKFVAAVMEVFPGVLLQWEDFLKGNAITQLHRFKDKLCSFNDDIQGTAGVVVAGLFGALRITKIPWSKQRIVFAGAGASAQGISDLIVAAMTQDGLNPEESKRQIWTVDSKGLCLQTRSGLEDFKATYARPASEVADWTCVNKAAPSLEETIKHVKPTILIGTSTIPGMFTEGCIRAMAASCERPIIMPLSNPTSKAECTPEQAFKWADGRCIVATGSPFAPVTYNGKVHKIGQGNNAYIFPGVGLGCCVSKCTRVSDAMFLAAANALAECVSEEDLAATHVYPSFKQIREISHKIAVDVIKQAVKEGYADPNVLENVEAKVKRAQWFPKYFPIRYEPFLSKLPSLDD